MVLCTVSTTISNTTLPDDGVCDYLLFDSLYQYPMDVRFGASVTGVEARDNFERQALASRITQFGMGIVHE